MNRAETKKAFNKDKLCSGIAMAMLVVSGDVLAETVLEEVVVTATRRAQSTLEVPTTSPRSADRQSAIVDYLI